MQFVTRLAAQGTIAPAVVAEAFAAGPAQVRCAILAALPPGAPEALCALVPMGLAQGTPEEQLEAFEAALRAGPPGLHDLSMRWLDGAGGDVASGAWARLRGLPPDEAVSALPRTSFSLCLRALAALLPPLRDHVRARLAATAEGRYLPDERPSPWRWEARYHYKQLLKQLERFAPRPSAGSVSRRAANLGPGRHRFLSRRLRRT